MIWWEICLKYEPSFVLHTCSIYHLFSIKIKNGFFRKSNHFYYFTVYVGPTRLCMLLTTFLRGSSVCALGCCGWVRGDYICVVVFHKVHWHMFQFHLIGFIYNLDTLSDTELSVSRCVPFAALTSLQVDSHSMQRELKTEISTKFWSQVAD